jgi:hypothetical protein
MVFPHFASACGGRSMRATATQGLGRLELARQWQ